MEFEQKSLDWWVKNLHLMSRDTWLWIPNDTKSLAPDTICYAVEDDLDLSPEELDQRDDYLEQVGLKCFFHKDQLKDIESNLRTQKENMNQDDLLRAINHYWKNDAFINYSNT